MGDECKSTERFVLRYNQRYDLGHSNGDANHGGNLHDLGQQYGRFNLCNRDDYHNDAVPGPFEYDPENNTWANDSLIHLAPDFINYVSGNGSTWLVTDITSGISGLGPGAYFEVLIGDTIYFDADDGTDGSELWAHDLSLIHI